MSHCTSGARADAARSVGSSGVQEVGRWFGDTSAVAHSLFALSSCRTPLLRKRFISPKVSPLLGGCRQATESEQGLGGGVPVGGSPCLPLFLPQSDLFTSCSSYANIVLSPAFRLLLIVSCSNCLQLDGEVRNLRCWCLHEKSRSAPFLSSCAAVWLCLVAFAFSNLSCPEVFFWVRSSKSDVPSYFSHNSLVHYAVRIGLSLLTPTKDFHFKPLMRRLFVAFKVPLRVLTQVAPASHKTGRRKRIWKLKTLNFRWISLLHNFHWGTSLK